MGKYSFAFLLEKKLIRFSVDKCEPAYLALHKDWKLGKQTICHYTWIKYNVAGRLLPLDKARQAVSSLSAELN